MLKMTTTKLKHYKSCRAAVLDHFHVYTCQWTTSV